MNKLLLFFIAFANISFAQNNNRQYLGYKIVNGDNISVKVSDGEYLLKFYNENIVENTFLPSGETYNPESHAVVLIPKIMEIKTIEKDNKISLRSPGISVEITKNPFQITYYYTTELISEKAGYIKKDSTEAIEFNLDQNEKLFGGGARVLGMNRRGNKLQLYNRALYGYETKAELMNFTMPLVMSSKIYAVHFDNAPIGYLDLDSKKNNTLAYETISGRKTYQVVAADDWENLMAKYSELTGRQPLPPRWALGNFSSRFGYHSQAEVLATAKRFRDEKIPLDAIILDLYWFGKTIQGTLGNFEFDRDSFPEPKKMIDQLSAENVKTILITEPFVLTTSSKWQEAVDKKILATDASGKPYVYDFYFGNTGLIDIFKKEGREWFWDIYKKYTQMGVAGWWGDLGEPEVHPSALRHAVGTADELHNIYGHNWAKLVAEGYKKDFPNQRPFILMRAGYSGSQRFGMIPWSGDVSRSWGGLSGQVEIALQMGMQGMGYVHSDLGGFANANRDDELYYRWLQYGVFNPIFRPHAQEEVASEPVFREKRAKELAKKAIELRYRLLPYNYTLAFENSQNGMPLMRPIFFAEPANDKALNDKTSYFWGDNIYVAPVFEPGQKTMKTYLPNLGYWFDFYSGKKYEGGQEINIRLTDQYIPTFVRGGAFLPMIDVIQSTEDYASQKINLNFYFDENCGSSHGILYDDDGKTPGAFAKGNYQIDNYKSEFDGKKLEIQITNETGNNFNGNPKDYILDFLHIGEPRKIKINGKRIDCIYNKFTEIIRMEIRGKKNFTNKIEIRL